MVGEGRGLPTPIPKEAFDKWVNAKKGGRQGFFISLTMGDLRYTPRNESVGTVFKENKDLQLTIGVANSKYSFGAYHELRLWNGVVHYTVKRSPSDALATTF